MWWFVLAACEDEPNDGGTFGNFTLEVPDNPLASCTSDETIDEHDDGAPDVLNHLEYDDLGFLAFDSQDLGADGQLDFLHERRNDFFGNALEESYDFDGDGVVDQISRGQYDVYGNPVRTEMDWDADGVVDELTLYEIVDGVVVDGDVWVGDIRTGSWSFEYDDRGRLTSQILRDVLRDEREMLYRYTWHETLDLFLSLEFVLYDVGGQEYRIELAYTWDEQQRLESSYALDDFGTERRETTRIYGYAGSSALADSATVEVAVNGAPTSTGTEQWAYDAAGRVVEQYTETTDLATLEVVPTRSTTVWSCP